MTRRVAGDTATHSGAKLLTYVSDPNGDADHSHERAHQ